jgi:hypothetical protein
MMSVRRDSVAVEDRAGLKLIFGAAVRAAGLAIVADIKKDPRMVIPQRHFWIRAKRRQIVSLQLHNR